MELNEFGRPIRPICFTPEQDRLLALGYPHLIRLVDGHPDAKKAEKHATKAVFSNGGYHVDYPREVACRISQAALHPGFSASKEVNAAMQAAVKNEAPLDEDGAREALRGLTPDELEDRLVPDLGLADDGTLTLDFGARTFVVGFDETLTPWVRGADGKRTKKLPKPGAKDDPAAAKAAVARFKALQKDVGELASTHLLRLERAMCEGRRWSPDEHRALFVSHPLMTHLAQRLVWGVYRNDRLETTFRVDGGRALADLADTPVTVGSDGRVGIVHRLELGDEAAAGWGAILADYELAQPFDQLQRSVYTITADETEATELRRFEGREVRSGAILGLRARGWYGGPPQDSGGVWAYHKDVDTLAGPATARVFLVPGLPADPSEPQTLHEVVVTPRADETARGESFHPFGALDAVAFSELIRDLEGLAP
ncbi:MAG: DUF4132 domain-containing protein [Myxococcales bacterium]|nr:DUF4132 domain-containing protein [Myxococcales bacterium]